MKAKINIIFLDIDGVLNGIKFFEETDDYTWDMFSPNSVILLNKLTDLTNAKIIISSDWRKQNKLSELKEIFLKNKIKAEIIGKIPIIKFSRKYSKPITVKMPRGLEIQQALEQEIPPNESINYVIIDDDASGILLHQKEHFVQTDSRYGFSMIDFEKSCNILL